MRQLQVLIPPDDAEEVLRLAEEHSDTAPVSVEARRADGSPGALVVAQIPNHRVGDFVEAVEDLAPEAAFTLLPRGTLPFGTPLSSVQEALRSVTRLSTLELTLSALQSVGSWKSMLLYALFSGLVAAYAVIFSIGYLLVGAMLIAPIGAPAMVSVVGIAIGDGTMLRRGLVRFWVGIAVLAAAALGLGLAYGLEASSSTMEQITNLSLWSLLLAVVGGAAGAQALVQSDRDSLVTATATGFLVAVALSPPAAVLGLSVAIRRWDYTGQMGFILVLTYVGILLGGWFSLAIRGIGSEPGLRGGDRWLRAGALGAAAVLALGLLGWQATRGPELRKADLSREALVAVREAVRETAGLRLVEAGARFTRPERGNGRAVGEAAGEAMLIDVVTERTAGEGVPIDEATLEGALRRAIEARVLGALEGTTPFVRISILPSPSARP